MPIYMQYEGIEGPVTAKGFEKWIEVNDFHFGVNRNIATRTGQTSDRENTLPTVGEIELELPMSEASTKLFNEACVGKAKKATIVACQTGSGGTGAPRKYVEYDLSDVLVSAHSVSIPTGELPREKLRLNFNKVEMKYTPFSEGNVPKAPSATGYDQRSGTKV